MNSARRGLGPPRGDLRSLPAEELSGAQLWRIHRASVDPLHASSGPHGRFNLEAPAGTLYAGAVPLAAFVEVFGRLAIVDQREAAGYRLTELRTESIRVADLTSRSVLGKARITAEIHSATDYSLTRAWAHALADAGFDGIRYRARHDPAGSLDSVALFAGGGPGGPGGTVPAATAATGPIPDDLIASAEAEFGLLVAPRRLRRR